MNIDGNRAVWQPSRQWLELKYVTEKKILSEIGKECGVSAATVMRALEGAGIPRRNRKTMMMKRGADNGNWRGERASYSAMHKRLYKILGKAKYCEGCGTKGGRFDWANKTGSLDDSSDYVSLCHRCHMQADNKKRIEEKGRGFL